MASFLHGGCRAIADPFPGLSARAMIPSRTIFPRRLTLVLSEGPCSFWSHRLGEVPVRGQRI